MTLENGGLFDTPKKVALAEIVSTPVDKRTKGILFDMDGVLVDSEKWHEVATAKMLAEYGINYTHEDYIKYSIGRVPREQFKELKEAVFPEKLANADVEAMVKQKEANYTALRGNVEFYPGVVEMLRELSKEFRIGIVSSGMPEGIKALLKKADIENLFDVIITGNDVKSSKPNPEGYRLGMTALGLKPEDTVGVEDAYMGGRAVSLTKRTGEGPRIKLIGVTTTTTAEKLYMAGADWVISKTTDLNRGLIMKVLEGRNNYSIEPVRKSGFEQLQRKEALKPVPIAH